MSQDRSALLTALAGTMTAAGDAEPGPWDGFSLLADITALGVRLTGFRYSGAAPGQPLLMDSAAIETIAELRAASPGPDGELFDVYVARFNRASAEIVDQAFTAQTGAAYPRHRCQPGAHRRDGPPRGSVPGGRLSPVGGSGRAGRPARAGGTRGHDSAARRGCA